MYMYTCFFFLYVIKTIQIEILDPSEALHFPLTWPYSSFCERPSTPGLPTVFIYRCFQNFNRFFHGKVWHYVVSVFFIASLESSRNGPMSFVHPKHSKTPAAALFPKYTRLIKIHV